MQLLYERKRIGLLRVSALLILLTFLLTGCVTYPDGTETGVTGTENASGDGTGNAGDDENGTDVTEEPSRPELAEESVTIERSTWIEAYKDYIRNVDVNGAYELIYLNGDEVPEVVYQSDITGDTRTIILYSYCMDETGGYVIAGYLGFDCSVPRYIPGEGYIVCQSRDYRDMDSDYVCLLTHGKIHRLFKGIVFKEKSQFLFNVVTEEHGNEDIHSYNEYNKRMKSVFDRFLDLVYCGNGTYKTEEALWEAMEQTPEKVTCIYLTVKENADDQQ